MKRLFSAVLAVAVLAFTPAIAQNVAAPVELQPAPKVPATAPAVSTPSAPAAVETPSAPSAPAASAPVELVKPETAIDNAMSAPAKEEPKAAADVKPTKEKKAKAKKVRKKDAVKKKKSTKKRKNTKKRRNH